MPWSNSSILEAIPNPTKEAYEVKIDCPELTFVGVREQPDFAVLHITYYPIKKVVELRSLKKYIFDFRNRTISYERLINVIYDDLMEVYEPKRLRLVMECNPRGGISSVLTIDSDWSVRGGKEEFKDWLG